MFHGSVYQVTLVPEAIHLSKAIRDWWGVEKPINTPAATPEVTGSRPTGERMGERMAQGTWASEQQACLTNGCILARAMVHRQARDRISSWGNPWWVLKTAQRTTFVKTFQFTTEMVWNYKWRLLWKLVKPNNWTQKMEERKIPSPEVLFGGCFKFAEMQERRCCTKGMGSFVDWKRVGS